MTCDCPEVIQYVIECKENDLALMEEAQFADIFFFHKGKVHAFNEILRVLLDD